MMYFVSDETARELEKQENCRALLCIENSKEKFCGDIVMGKVRYCARHSQKTSSQHIKSEETESDLTKV